MSLRIVTWLVSIGIHGLFAAALLIPEGGVALEQGSGEDIMVVEQGIALQGFAKLGEDLVSVEAVEAPPIMTAAAQPLEQVEAVEEVKPIEEQQVLMSEAGPEQENVIEPQEVEKEAEPEEIKEPEPEKVEQPLPQQVATIQQENVIAMRESSGEEKKGGDATARRAYLGKLRSHLERSKVNPRTTIVGIAVVTLMVGSDGALISHEVTKSSGSKVLDDAAMASIEKASPFPPIPANVGQDRIEFSVPFKFTVR